MNEANRNLLVRIASAAVLVPPLVTIILWQRPEPTAILVSVAALIGLIEFYWIVLQQDPPWLKLIGVACGGAVSYAAYWQAHRPEILLAILLGATLLAAILHMVRFRKIEDAAAGSAMMLFGLLYVPFLLSGLALLKAMPEGSDWVFLVLSITFGADTGAYAAGRSFGRHKLYPAVSPGKTVEGAVGGLASSFAAAAVAKLWYMPQLSWLDAVLIAIPGSALGQAGDLVESMFKRAFKVKDSGWISPGHGGILDRIDALLFVSAYTFVYAKYVFFAR